MSTQRSEKYYFLRGDVVLKVEDTLFKLHRDILDTHSGFFQDMFSVPTSDEKEGSSDEYPLTIPTDLCTAQSFTMLCKFMYPRVLGVLPSIEAKELDIWEPVLRVTAALQMDGARKYILSQLARDTANIPSNAARLLLISLRYTETPDMLPLECLRIIVYRRRPMTLAESTALGLPTTLEIMIARERLRNALLSRTFHKKISISENCIEMKPCSITLYRGLADTIAIQPTNGPHQDDADIFDVDMSNHACYLCADEWSSLADILKEHVLDSNILQCFESLRKL